MPWIYPEIICHNKKNVTLSRFLLKLLKKEKPYSRLLKGPRMFILDAKEMFQDIKKDIVSLPILVSLPYNSMFILYLAMSNLTISLVLVFQKGKKQSPIYFTSCILQLAEECYQVIKKLVFTLIFSMWRLCQYFHIVYIPVQIDYPITQVLQKLELVSRMISWSIELSNFGLWFDNRGPMKTQLFGFLIKL